MDTADAGHHCRIVANGAVAMQLDQIVENAGGIVEHARTVGVAGELHAFPRRWRCLILIVNDWCQINTFVVRSTCRLRVSRARCLDGIPPNGSTSPSAGFSRVYPKRGVNASISPIYGLTVSPWKEKTA